MTLRRFTAVAILSPLAIGFLASVASAQPSSNASSASEAFSICGSGQRITCVVDGDTFWFRGEKIRIADIDTP
nr:thermonuclease family protein [Agrobacterium rosae]